MKAKHEDPLNVRLPIGMRDNIRQLAERNRRSMNSQIVVILEGALSSAERENPATAATVPGSVHQQ